MRINVALARKMGLIKKALKKTKVDYTYPIDLMCDRAGLPIPVFEFAFAPPRRWRFDWAWPEKALALEIEGGIWVHGRHNRAPGYLKDMEKYNKAACLGYRVIRCTPKEVKTGAVLALLKEALK